MERPSRRRLLAAVAASTALAGCNATGTPTGSDEPTPAPTETETPSPTATDTPLATDSPTHLTVSEVEFVGSVVRQPTPEAPGRIQASLTNHTGRTLEIIGGDPLPVSNAVDSGPDNALLLYPDPSDSINEYRWSDAEEQGIDAVTYDDCWRAPSGLIQTAMGSGVELSPGRTVDANYTALGLPDADCPRGTYTAAEELTLRRSEQTVRLELDVTIANDVELATVGRLSVNS